MDTKVFIRTSGNVSRYIFTRSLLIAIFVLTLALAFPFTVYADDGALNPPPVSTDATQPEGVSDEALPEETVSEDQPQDNGEETPPPSDPLPDEPVIDSPDSNDSTQTETPIETDSIDSSNTDGDSLIEEIPAPVENPITPEPILETETPEPIVPDPAPVEDPITPEPILETETPEPIVPDPYFEVGADRHTFLPDGESCGSDPNCQTSLTPVQDALNAAAGYIITNNTIYIDGGIYTEDLIIDKSLASGLDGLILQATGLGGAPVINGNVLFKNLTSFTFNGITVLGLITIQDSTGIEFIGGSGADTIQVTITGNIAVQKSFFQKAERFCDTLGKNSRN